MQIIHTIAELRTAIGVIKQSGKRVAFVPTMGNLHEGHLQLVKQAKTQAESVVCSIFVNPLQFGENEDFELYPRTLPADADKLKLVECDIIFAPEVSQMYARGVEATQVVVPGISTILEGQSRPGHFTGVATVVTKLFNMVQPDMAVFGAKDYQQLQIIRQLVADLDLPIEIIAHPIVRESSGLALSSRNNYLTDAEKDKAAQIYQHINDLSVKIKAGKHDSLNYKVLEQDTINSLNAKGFVCDYITVRAADLSLPEEHTTQLVILAAVYLGKTRLLDNLIVSL